MKAHDRIKEMIDKYIKFNNYLPTHVVIHPEMFKQLQKEKKENYPEKNISPIHCNITIYHTDTVEDESKIMLFPF